MKIIQVWFSFLSLTIWRATIGLRALYLILLNFLEVSFFSQLNNYTEKEFSTYLTSFTKNHTLTLSIIGNWILETLGK